MKKHPVLTIVLLAVVCVAVAAVWRYRTQLFPGKHVSPLFALYEGTPGVEADFISRLRVNDSVSVDVTLLHATDTAAWAALVTDFNVAPPTDSERDVIAAGRDIIRLVRYSDALPPCGDALPSPVVAVSTLSHTVSVFHVASDIEKHAILYYNFDRS